MDLPSVKVMVCLTMRLTGMLRLKVFSTVVEAVSVPVFTLAGADATALMSAMLRMANSFLISL